MSIMQFIILISDGVEYSGVRQWTSVLQSVGVDYILASPLEYSTVETVQESHRGPDMPVSCCLDSLHAEDFDGVVLPDGLLSTGQMRHDARVLQLIVWMYENGRLVFVSGSSVELLYNAHLIASRLVICNAERMDIYLKECQQQMAEGEWRSSAYRPLPFPRVYRPTM